MLTNNYWKLKAFVDSHGMSNTGAVGNMYVSNIGMIDTYGISRGITYGWYPDGSCFSVMNRNWTLRKDLQFYVSSDSTTPDKDDYEKTGDLIGSISNFTSTVNTTQVDGNEITTVTLTGLNVTGNEFIIRKVGFTKVLGVGLNTYNNTLTTSEVLMGTQLLEEPVTVPSNKGFTITFAWDES